MPMQQVSFFKQPRGSCVVECLLGMHEAWAGSVQDALGVRATFYRWEAFAFWIAWTAVSSEGHPTTSCISPLGLSCFITDKHFQIWICKP